MKRNARTASLTAVAMGVMTIAPIVAPPASAGTTAATSNVLSVSSGTVQVFATAAQTFTNTGVALSTSISNGTPKNFFINNSGSLSMSRFTLTITLPNSSNVSAFRRCNLNVSFTGTNTCASGSPTVVTNPVSGSATSYTLSLPANSYYSFQIVQNKTGTLTVATLASLTYVVAGVSNS